MDLPKLLLYDGVEYKKLLKGFNMRDHVAVQSYLNVLNVDVTYGDVEGLLKNGSMSNNLISFFMNYLQNENLVRGEDVSRKVYFGFIAIKLYDGEGNLEYDTIPECTQLLILPNYVKEVFNEIIVFCNDLDRWFALYLDKTKQVGVLIDYK